jgi:hypothetical protein
MKDIVHMKTAWDVNEQTGHKAVVTRVRRLWANKYSKRYMELREKIIAKQEETKNGTESGN